MQTLQTVKRSDPEIQRFVLQELKWDPRVDETEVGVQVRDGVVTLTGRIGSFGKKQAAAQAAHRVFGVFDVANDLEVVQPGKGVQGDPEVALAVRDALRWNVFVDEKSITSTVAKGWVTLEGEVAEWFQKDAASRAVRDLEGVLGVSNMITVKRPAVDAKTIRAAIEGALLRQADREAKQVHVEVKDGIVKLTGTVRSWSEKRAAERAAGFAPGVLQVKNELAINSFL